MVCLRRGIRFNRCLLTLSEGGAFRRQQAAKFANGADCGMVVRYFPFARRRFLGQGVSYSNSLSK